MKYLLIDSQNMFYRAAHVTRGSPEMRGGMSIHIMLMMINQAWKMFGADHMVVALECRNKDNWRKLVDERYKQNRVEGQQALTPKEKEEQEVLFTILNDYLSFVKDHTNASVLQCPVAEADDMIARWIQRHPNDEHIIISSDKDFQQLLTDNVIQYNGISKKIFMTETSSMASMSYLPKDWKIEKVEDPEYILFEKIVRGDSGDNVFPSFPGVRKKAKAGKPSVYTAYDDRHDRGYDWNNFMMQKWTDHHGNEHLVRDDFERNRQLVDLNAHPEGVKEIMDEFIDEVKNAEHKSKVGFYFSKFCQKYDLNMALDNLDDFAAILGSHLND